MQGDNLAHVVHAHTRTQCLEQTLHQNIVHLSCFQVSIIPDFLIWINACNVYVQV